MDPQTAVQKNGTESSLLQQRIHRRKFLLFTGTAASVALIGTACDKDDNNDNGINLGGGDVGILNYAYALEQLEAAFYMQVMLTPYASMPTIEAELLKDIRDHEIAHRELFKNALGSNKIQDLEVNFTSINFSSRESVLGTAKAFEDLGVSAYNGAGKLLQNIDYLLLAGKIVSVEARHAAIIRELLPAPSGTVVGTAFASADVVSMDKALDLAKTPNEVLATASAFLKSKLNASNLPTS